jgi:TolB-like protein
MKNRKAYQWIWMSGLLLVCGARSVQADDLSSVAKKLTKATQSLKSKRIAVLLFPYSNGDVSSATTLISERLTALLGKTTSLQIVDKSHLALTLSKISLDQTGKDSGVDAVVTGTLQEVDHHRTLVNARLIQVPSGVILVEASAKIKQTWYDPPQPPPEPENPNAPYVMHASPYIFTPQGNAGTGAPEPGVAEASGNVAADVSAPVSAPTPVAANSNNTYTGSPEDVVLDRDRHEKQEDHRHDDKGTKWNQSPASYDPHQAAVRSEFYYAAGLTLEQQGHGQDGARLYASSVKESPAPSPLQTLAEKHSKQDSSN